MDKIGIITYHAAYNYGSVLQAYATQYAVEKLGYTAEIINYRMPEQRRFYSMYRSRYGVRTTIKDIMQVPIHKKRMSRRIKFEDFFVKYFNLSEEFAEPEEFKKIYTKYDTIISGSDQIWNKHSCELERNNWKYMNPYLLDGYMGKKISYASSIANMTDEELEYIIPYITIFNNIAMRERQSAEKMTLLLNRRIVNVLDPTFLLSKEDWCKSLELKKTNEEPYILYYSLGGPQNVMSHKDFIKAISKKFNCKVKIVTPATFLPYFDKAFESHPEFGTVDFLEAILNAKAVISDSYHGTILSVNFEKELYSICKLGGSEFRKTDILERLGLQDRIIYDPNDMVEKKFEPIDYNKVNKKLEMFREHSLNYLKNALK